MRTRFRQRDGFFSYLFSSKIFPVLGLILAILITYSLVKKIEKKRGVNQEISGIIEEIDNLENKNNELKEMIDYLESSTFLEKEARVNLDLKKPEEKVVVVKGLEKSEENKSEKSIFMISGLDKRVKPPEETNPQKWWGYFFEVNTNSHK